MNRNAIFTISSKNYIHYASTLLSSVSNVNRDVDLYLILVDSKENISFEIMDINVIWVEDLGISDFEKMSFKYNLLELNTNIKPTVFKKLLDTYNKVIYLDPDIYVYSSLSFIFNELDNKDILVTPHMLQPQYKHHHDKPEIMSEVENLKTGAYNLGFFALNNSSESLRFLEWWENCCRCCAFDEHEGGVFVDQKWISLVTCYFNNVGILRHNGLNVAYWNIHERIFTENDNKIFVNNDPLIFFHFSGHSYVDGEKNKLSKHLLSYDVQPNSILSRLLNDYNIILSNNKKLIKIFCNIDYGFARFNNNELISDFVRRIYSKYINNFEGNPFDITNDFYKFAKKNKLTTGKFEKSANIDTIKLKSSKKIFWLENVLFIIHKVLGVEKFSLLLRFLRHYSIPTNYAKVFRNKIM